MQPINADTAANWTVDRLKADTSWIVELDDRARRDLFADPESDVGAPGSQQPPWRA